jgi:Icc-related predicted phosphoesterase
MIRIAAFADCHAAGDTIGRLRPHLGALDDHADVVLIGGDLTKCGTADEAKVLVEELRDIATPIYAVLGNHDHHADEVDAVVKVLDEGGVRVLEGDTATVQVDGHTLGIAGVKGFGGGFAGACGSEFGEREMKAFIQHTKSRADVLRDALASLDTDARVALMHYAPVDDTLTGERHEIYPFLGSYLLAEAVDVAGADLVLHGHAHGGQEHGTTPGGVPVRNVAQPVIRAAYKVYTINI